MLVVVRTIESLSLAIATGADGLIIEVHDKPFEALSDGIQSIKPDRFASLMEKLKVAHAIGRICFNKKSILLKLKELSTPPSKIYIVLLFQQHYLMVSL